VEASGIRGGGRGSGRSERLGWQWAFIEANIAVNIWTYG
jgi:hypothetical protein